MLAGVLFLRLYFHRPWQPCGNPGNAPIVDLDQRIIDQQACGANGDAGRRRLIHAKTRRSLRGILWPRAHPKFGCKMLELNPRH